MNQNIKTWKVKELIVELQKRSPESVVQSWDGYCDIPTNEMYLSDMRDGTTMICNINFGPEEKHE